MEIMLRDFGYRMSHANRNPVVLGGLLVSMFAIGPKVFGFKRGRGRWIFKSDKNLQHALLRKGIKSSTPCREILRYVKEPLEV
jgi:hypothetical protein